MLTDELTTLIIIEEVGKLTKRPTSCPREITYDRINYICDRLISRGYLAENKLVGYQLTSRGKDAILWKAIRLVTCEDEGCVKYRMERLEQLYDEISHQVDNFSRKEQRGSLDEEYSTMPADLNLQAWQN